MEVFVFDSLTASNIHAPLLSLLPCSVIIIKPSREQHHNPPINSTGLQMLLSLCDEVSCLILMDLGGTLYLLYLTWLDNILLKLQQNNIQHCFHQ